MPFRRATRNTEPLEEAALFERAVQALGRRMRTVAEIRRLLKDRVEPGETGTRKIDAVIARLKEMRYLDDAGYASDYARLRQENASLGKRRVQQDLMRKGVHPELIAEKVDAAYEAISEEDLIRRHLERKRVRPPADQKQAARVMRLLVRAGFSTGSIFKVLKSWRVPEESLAELETIEDEPPPSD